MKLYKYQQECLPFIASQKYSYLNMYCGGGKTLTALEAVQHYSRILIICPAALTQNWADEIFKWYGNQSVFIAPTTTCAIPLKAKFIIVSYHKLLNPQLIFKQLIFISYQAVIVDEAHKIKNPEAKRTEALLGWTSKKPRLLTKPDIERVILLSGTPMMQRPFELYSVLRGLRPELLGEYNTMKKFGLQFCRAYQDTYGKWVYNGADNLEELAQMVSPFIKIIPRTRVERELPEFRQKIVRFDICQELVRQEQQYDLSAIETSQSDVPFSGLSELRHLMAIQKAPIASQYIEELLLCGERVIIFCWHRAVINSLLMSLPLGSLRIDGSVPLPARTQNIKDFNDGKAQAIVCQISAASEGISLHTATHVVFAEISWNPADNEQCYKRVHRRGQKNKVLAHYLVVKNSLDDRILKNVLTKEQTVGKFNRELMISNNRRK